jgi:hypothetical protein
MNIEQRLRRAEEVVSNPRFLDPRTVAEMSDDELADIVRPRARAADLTDEDLLAIAGGQL